MKCIYCNHPIEKSDDFFKVELYLQGKLKGADFAHRICHLNKGGMELKLNKLITGVSDFAVRQGIIPEEQIVL